MARRKKEDATVAKSAAPATTPEEAKVALESAKPDEEVPKPVTKGKRKGKDQAPPESSPPKRTLRSNSSKTTLVEPEKVIVEKKVRKAPAKAKKPVEETNGHAEEDKEVVTNGKSDDAVVSTESKETAKTKGRKGKKAENGNSEVDKKTDVAEPEAKSVNGTAASENEKPKAAKGKGRPKKDDKKTALENDDKTTGDAQGTSQAETETGPNKGGEKKVVSEEDVEKKSDVDPKENGKGATGRGKKKNEKSSKDAGATTAKQTKKDAVTKPVAKVEEGPVEEPKTASTETKKGGASKVKEVAVEHWNAERIKSILGQFCIPSVVFSINKKAPRSKSFEITIVKENGEAELIWSGIKKGPPRKEKFPSDEEVKELGEKFLL